MVFLNAIIIRKMVQCSIEALVLCGPSGSGKSTLLKKLLDDFPDKFQFSISHTTRSPRPGEINGVHYYFTTKEDMSDAIENGDFIETAVFSGNIYGTSKKSVEDCVKKGKICVLDIDVQGVKQIKETDLNALYVFIKPPSLDSLADRLRNRGTETDETLEKRLNAAKSEIGYGETPNNFHLVIINDSIDIAYAKLKNFIMEQLFKQRKESGDE
ncbi:Guanylate kinase, putative [Pediculus humanus corporis]|uniref:guanylate kinase n=1 Tax=Pediculus humanus subsp. corporis TaxID=121224 RepID=E0VGF1_PEDHC|nr:Guanylate kinase, putative [Pediculus humanus corporis]EEB12457.1 Guanylate kinase, putative [Pediculus humanus corporis]